MFGPVVCLLAGVGAILLFILVLRFHAFLALISAALVVTFLSNRVGIDEAIPLVSTAFGIMMGKIGILLIMAAIIGKCLMDSGAAERIVRAFTRLFGAGREQYSLLTSGFVLSIPVFFDTVFYLLAPLARAVFARRKRNYVMVVMAAAGGGAITHALVPPTPGPIMVAEALDVSIGITIVVGMLAAIVPVILGGVFYARWIDKRMPNKQPADVLGVSQEELEKTSLKPDEELPGLIFSLLPFVLPVILLAGVSVIEAFTDFGQESKLLTVLGDKNFVFIGGAIIAIMLLISQKRSSLKETFSLLEPAIACGAVIAFITCGGSAFGAALKAAGIGDIIEAAAVNWNISLLVLAFLTAFLLRFVQGSATVAMVTTAGIIAASLGDVELAYHPVYLVSVIGFGATGISWMNDSGFWIFGQMTGLSEAETLKTWTAMLAIMSITGFFWVLLLSKILPMASS